QTQVAPSSVSSQVANTEHLVSPQRMPVSGSFSSFGPSPPWPPSGVLEPPLDGPSPPRPEPPVPEAGSPPAPSSSGGSTHPGRSGVPQATRWVAARRTSELNQKNVDLLVIATCVADGPVLDGGCSTTMVRFNLECENPTLVHCQIQLVCEGNGAFRRRSVQLTVGSIGRPRLSDPHLLIPCWIDVAEPFHDLRSKGDGGTGRHGCLPGKVLPTGCRIAGAISLVLVFDNADPATASVGY